MHKPSLTKINLLITMKKLKHAIAIQALLESKKNILLHEHREQEKAQEIRISKLKHCIGSSEKINLDHLPKPRIIADLSVTYKVIMGISLPKICKKKESKPFYALAESTTAIDEAFCLWQKIKSLLEEIAIYGISQHVLMAEIKKAHKGARVLENKIIPECKSYIREIAEYIEESERGEITRLRALNLI